MTGDGLRDDAHHMVLAALFPVISECPLVDKIILADWTSEDYGILLDLIYRQIDR